MNRNKEMSILIMKTTIKCNKTICFSDSLTSTNRSINRMEGDENYEKEETACDITSCGSSVAMQCSNM